MRCPMHQAKLVYSRLCWNSAGSVRTMSTLRTVQVQPRAVFEDDDNDVVIVSARRTPICKSFRGGFKVDHCVCLELPVICYRTHYLMTCNTLSDDLLFVTGHTA